MLKGVEGVIDKDYAGSYLATLIEAEILLILTDVEKIALNYNTPGQKDIDHMNTTQACQYLSEGHFPREAWDPR